MIRTPLQSTNQRYPIPLCTIIDIMKIVALEKRFVSSRGSLVSVNRLIQEIETNDGNFVFCITNIKLDILTKTQYQGKGQLIFHSRLKNR